MNLNNAEEKDGVRFVWNILPDNKLNMTRAVYPIALHYGLDFPLQSCNQQLVYKPVSCKCELILNPYVHLDYNSKHWQCPKCLTQNSFPQKYQLMMQQQKPFELQEGFSTVQYVTNRSLNQGSYLIVIDQCMSLQELTEVKKALNQQIINLNDQTLIGLITFHRSIFVYDLSTKLSSLMCFSCKEYSAQKIQELLRIQIKNDPRGISTQIMKKYLMPVKDVRDKILSRINNIRVDPFITVNQRNHRATGAALNIALAIMEMSPWPGRILTFLSGPCTVGPGKIVDPPFKSQIRSAVDIQKGENVDHMKSASKFYSELAKRASLKLIIFDIFAFTLDQYGLVEMSQLITKTGGLIVMHQEFLNNMFRHSLAKYFEKDVENYYKNRGQCKVNIYTSKQLKVTGAFGQCTSLKIISSFVSSNEIGEGGTSSWYVGGIDQTKTITFTFEPDQQATNNSQAFIQIQTISRCNKNSYKKRVTSLVRQFAKEKDKNNQLNCNELISGFDQEAASILMVKHSIFRLIQQYPNSLIKWLDKCLYRFIAKFSTYQANNRESFFMPNQIKRLPQIMYHIRRSQFLNHFGSSPDETAYHRMILMRESVENCNIMVQPALLQYKIEDMQPTPVQLQQKSLVENVVLLLDSFFNLVLWHGSHVHYWVEQKFYQQEEYSHIKQLIESPQQDVQYIVNNRFPVPNYIETYPGHTKERYLKSKLLPSGEGQLKQENENFLTDDISIKSFVEYIVRLVLQNM